MPPSCLYIHQSSGQVSVVAPYASTLIVSLSWIGYLPLSVKWQVFFTSRWPGHRCIASSSFNNQSNCSSLCQRKAGPLNQLDCMSFSTQTHASDVCRVIIVNDILPLLYTGPVSHLLYPVGDMHEIRMRCCSCIPELL